jgi:hypothetical protein
MIMRLFMITGMTDIPVFVNIQCEKRNLDGC